MASWSKSLARWFGLAKRPAQRTAKAGGRCVRLQVETLEDRRVPATRIWDGGAVFGDNWSNANNWVDDIAPVAGDNLVFPGGIGALDRTTNNDFSQGTTFGSITFTGTDYTLSGNRIRLVPGAE